MKAFSHGASSLRQNGKNITKKIKNKIQCNKPPSPLLPTTGLRPYHAAGFNWKIREIAELLSILMTEAG